MAPDQPPLRVLMVVANIPGLNTGKGGHYYSAQEIASELNRHFELNVLVLGDRMPEAQAKYSSIDLVKCGSAPTLDVLRRIRSLVLQKRPNVIHCMDSASLLFMRLVNLSCQLPICWTKCGGRPLRYYTPRGSPDIVFHRDDFEFYHRKGFTPLLIPNRFRVPPGRSASPIDLQDRQLRIVRISRICEKYRDGLEKTIHLYLALKERIPNTTLDIIGFPEDYSVLSRLRDIGGTGVRFLIDDSVTREASRHLPQYTLAVASGRAAMEALSYGLPTLITPTDSPGPVLASTLTIDTMMAANFSERADLFETIEGSVKVLESLLLNSLEIISYRSWANNFYHKYISVESALDEYYSFYRKIIKNRCIESKFDLIKHLIFFQSTLFIRRLINARRVDLP